MFQAIISKNSMKSPKNSLNSTNNAYCCCWGCKAIIFLITSIQVYWRGGGGGVFPDFSLFYVQCLYWLGIEK